MTEQERLEAISHCESTLEALGRYPVLSIDIANVADHFDEIEDGDRGGFTQQQVREIAEQAAIDLRENELGVLPISDAIKHAADMRPDVILSDGTQQEMKLAHEVGKGPSDA